MNMNEKSFGCNNCENSFIINQDENLPILFCPFCGASEHDLEDITENPTKNES